MKRQLKHLAVTGALIVGTAMASAPSATAVDPGPPPTMSGAAMAGPDCVQYGSNVDGGVAQFDGSKPVRRGPAEVCENLGNRSGTFYIWCSKFNYLGHLWQYGRYSSSNVVGWVYHGNFSSISGSNGAKC